MHHLFIINPAAGPKNSTAALEKQIAELTFDHRVLYTTAEAQKSSLSGAFFFSSLYFLFPLYFAFLALIFFSTASTSHTARNAHSVPIIAPPSTSVG